MRNFKKIRQERLMSDFNAIPWDPMYRMDHINEKVTYFTQRILELYDKHAPYKEVRITRNAAPWVDNSSKEKMSRRDAAYRKAKKSGCKEDWKTYRRLRNEVTRIVRDSRDEFIDGAHHKQQTGIFWHLMRQQGGAKIKKQDGEPTVDLNELNSFFCIDNTDLDLSNTIQEYRNLQLADYSQLKIKPFNADQVEEVIGEMSSKAIGDDGVSITMLKLLKEKICPILTHIFNAIVQSNVYPDQWKRALITPIKKKRDASLVNEYRAINVLCVPGKLFDKLLYKQISKYVANNQILSPYQSAYRKHYSTQTALVKVIDDIRRAMDNREITIMVMIDCTRAFDTLNHRLLLEILKSLNFSYDLVKLFKSYLEGRKQRIKTKSGRISYWRDVKSGTPQGSTISALIFALFVNRILSVFRKASYMMYADDLQLYISCKVQDIDDHVSIINEELETLSKWCEGHALILNPQKCNFMILGHPRIMSNVDTSLTNEIWLDGHKLERVHEVKNLGLIIDENLTWKPHVQRVSGKIFAGLHQLKRMNYSPCRRIKKKLVETLLMPIIDYAAAAQTDMGIMNTNVLQVAQNATLRYIYRLPFDERMSKWHKVANWLKVHDRRQVNTFSLALSILKNKEPPYLLSNFIKRSEIHSRETKKVIRTYQVPKYKTDKLGKSFCVTSVKLLNSELSNSASSLDAVRLRESVGNFKEKLIRSYE